MAIGGVVIQFIADTAKAVRGIDNLEGSLRNVDGTTDKTHGTFGKLNAAWAAAIPIAGAVIGGAVALGNTLIDAGRAAMEDEQAADKLAETLSNIPGITRKAIDKNEDWISSMQLATHVADNDLREAIGKLTLATGSLTEAQRLTALAVDVAAGSGKNLSTITDALAKAVNGNTASLERQFPWLDKNKDGTVTLDEAVRGLKGAYEGAAEAAANKDPWVKLKIIWDELKESVGKWLLPVMEDLADWFKNPVNQKKIQEYIDKIGDFAETVGQDAVDALGSMIDWLKDPANRKKLEDLAQTFVNAAREVGTLIGQIQTLLGWIDKLPSNIVLNFITRTLGGGGGDNTRPGGPVPRSGAAAAQAAPPPSPSVLVTEEQVYRAVSRLLARGDARNGRAVYA